MLGVLKIFFSDIRSIASHFFVLLIIGGITILPSLYAWINIYANSDPYQNTGKIPVAVSSRDAGVVRADGQRINAAQEEIGRLKDDTTVGWTYVKNPGKAIRGVRSGKYYAAVVFEEDFSYDMHHPKHALSEKKTDITYYSNTKKNAVAAKITDAAAEELLDRINKRYVRSILFPYVRDVMDFSSDLDLKEEVDAAVRQLTGAKATLREYRAMIGPLLSVSADASNALNRAGEDIHSVRNSTKSGVEQAKNRYRDAKASAEDFNVDMEDRLDELETALDELEDGLEELETSLETGAKAQLISEIRANAYRLFGILQRLHALMPANPKTQGAGLARDAIDRMLAKSQEIHDLAQLIGDGDDAEDVTDQLRDDIQAFREYYETDLTGAFDEVIAETDTLMDRIDPLLSSVDETAAVIDPVLGSARTTIDSLDVTVTQLSVVLASLEGELDRAIDKLNEVSPEDRLQDAMKDGDAGRYTKYFTSPVKMKTKVLYPVARYGAAMTPFYSVLGIWVGAVVLTSLLNTHVDRKKHPGFTDTEYFFGRYLIFAVLGQIQAAIIVFGDIHLLDCEPKHPELFYAAAGAASLVFSLLIYAVVLAFGDLGKGITVVVMVLQIAGTGGSYPMEILPHDFQAIYRFFPFSYAINAVREAIGGTYGFAYVRYLAQLGVFAIAGLAIGLCIRKPFRKVNHFLAERLEETEVL